jgi:hypothetical protein
MSLTDYAALEEPTKLRNHQTLMAEDALPRFSLPLGDLFAG